ncbi:hypothetical protein L484_016606 [Morus notabilis]|uniref:Uncharacterized protein n=1 Tax=Morus notabilis TaxID=981085 RepID=W9QKZ6_9ROSA|nr:hypothetical protein L484_016606 [Morus notabilis]
MGASEASLGFLSSSPLLLFSPFSNKFKKAGVWHSYWAWLGTPNPMEGAWVVRCGSSRQRVDVAVVWVGEEGKGAFLVRSLQPLKLAKLCPMWCEVAAEDEGGG